jgi:hypothetical protein
MEFWTSGANEGELCELDQAHTWCSLGTRVQRKDVGVAWTDASKQPAATERCVTLQTRSNGSFGLNYSQCNATKSVLCEVYASRVPLFVPHPVFLLCSPTARALPAQQRAASMYAIKRDSKSKIIKISTPSMQASLFDADKNLKGKVCS